MKKWNVFLSICIGVIIWQAVSVYDAALEPKQSLIETAKERAKQKVSFAHIQDIYTYYGEKAYVVLVGTDRKGTKKIAWVPEKGGQIVVKRAERGMTEQEAIEQLKAKRHPKEIVSAKLGMEKGVPLWELTYIDQDNRYSFYYISFEDGTFLKRYSFQQ